MIYLDHHATTAVLPEAWEAMRPFIAETFGNPASAHAAGRKARQAVGRTCPRARRASSRRITE